MSRTNTDFSKHVIGHLKTAEIEQFYFHKPGTRIESVCFTILNTDQAANLVVTGDFGNWIFCRRFHPDTDAKVSEGYWCEKLRMYSNQHSHVFCGETAQNQIREMMADPDAEITAEEWDWLSRLNEAAEEGEWQYHATAMEYPDTFEAENIPRGLRLDYSLEAVFDAWEAMANMLKNTNKEETR